MEEDFPGASVKARVWTSRKESRASPREAQRTWARWEQCRAGGAQTEGGQWWHVAQWLYPQMRR